MDSYNWLRVEKKLSTPLDGKKFWNLTPKFTFLPPLLTLLLFFALVLAKMFDIYKHNWVFLSNFSAVCTLHSDGLEKEIQLKNFLNSFTSKISCFWSISTFFKVVPNSLYLYFFHYCSIWSVKYKQGNKQKAV